MQARTDISRRGRRRANFDGLAADGKPEQGSWSGSAHARRGLWTGVLVAGLLLATTGCSRSSETDTKTVAGAVDVLAGAPGSFPDFLIWAGQRLQEQPSPVAIPTPAEVPQRWRVIHLDDVAASGVAGVTSSWVAKTASARPLAELGPFRSDRPAPPAFAVRQVPKLTPDGRDALAMVITGLDLACADIGSIELTMKVPFGRHIEMNWKKAGVILIPVESHDKPFTVRVMTDDFAEWNGRLGRIGLNTDGMGRGVVEISRVRFLPREDSYPEATGVKRVRLGHVIRSAVYAHQGTQIKFGRLRLPDGARFNADLGCVAGADGSTTTFELTIQDGEKSEKVLSASVTSGAGWSNVSADLSRWGGRDVDVTMRVVPASPGAVGFWGNPVIYQPVEKPPILIVYLIDTLAAEHMSLYGFQRDTAPALSALAAEGVLFAHAFSNSSRTVESIPDLMLSLHTERNGVHHNSTPAPPELVTIADSLRAAGMATVSFCTNVNAGPRQGMDQGFDTFVDKIGYYWTHVDRTVPIEEVVAWMDAHADRPMFLYIHTAEPHAPYTPPEGFAGRFDPHYTGSIDGTYDRRHGFHSIRRPRERLRDLRHVVALYDEEILYADHRFKLFADRLRARGDWPRVRLLVTADHGEEFLQHGMWEHGTDLHNEQTRVPLIAAGPGLRRGVQVHVPVQLVDIMPTILDMYGLPAPYALDGQSLWPVVSASGGPLAAAQDSLRARQIYGSNHNYQITHNLIEYYVIEGGRWKLLYGWRTHPIGPDGPDSHFMLFDLNADPRERENLIATHQDLARRLVGDLVRWRVAQHVYDAGRKGPTQIDTAQMRQLQQLGYIGGDEADDESDQ